MITANTPAYLAGMSIRDTGEGFPVMFKGFPYFTGTKAECIADRQGRYDAAAAKADAVMLDIVRNADATLTLRDEIEAEFGVAPIQTYARRPKHIEFFLPLDCGHVFGDAYTDEALTLDGVPVSAEYAALYRLRENARYALMNAESNAPAVAAE